jgi:hypothetical protein
MKENASAGSSSAMQPQLNGWLCGRENGAVSAQSKMAANHNISLMAAKKKIMK